MKRICLVLAAAIFLAALAIPQVSPALSSEEAAPAALAGDPQTPPPPPAPGVSPADPSMEVPHMDGGCCCCCGAANRCSGWRHKDPMGRPALGAGQGSHRSRAHRSGPRSDDRSGGAQGFGMGPHQGMHGDFEGAGPRGGVPAERMLRHAKDLKLTEEQIDTLEKLSFETKKTLVGLHAEIEKEELEIQNLLRSGSDDLAAVSRHLAAVSKARADIQEARIANLFEARKVLTEKQKQTMKEGYPRLGAFLD